LSGVCIKRNKISDGGHIKTINNLNERRAYYWNSAGCSGPCLGDAALAPATLGDEKIVLIFDVKNVQKFEHL